MLYAKKIQLKSGNSTSLISKLFGIKSASSAKNVQKTKKASSSSSVSENEYVDVQIDESNKNIFSSSPSYNAKNTTENQYIIKQLETEIEKLKSEYEVSQQNKGIAGNIGGFFSSCWNKVNGKGFKDNDKVELDNKIALLESAKADSTKLAEAYKTIMGADLTDEIKQNSVESQYVADSLSTEEKQMTIDLLKQQANSLSQLMQETKDNQGWFSKAVGGINNVLGFGTNSIKADAKIEDYIKQINSLNPEDPDFASKYQTLTGEPLSFEGLNDLFQGASKVGNSSAAEAIMDYEQTQASGKEIASGVVTGLVVAGGVVAAPFTGGASLAGTVAFGAALGGATTVLINGTDTIGTDKKYSLENGVLDFAGGAINGAVTAMTLGGAGLAGKGFSFLKSTGSNVVKQTAEQMVSGGFKNTVKTAFNGLGKTVARSAGIAGFSSTSNYLLNTVGTNALYDATGNYAKSDKPSNIIQNEDGTYSLYYELRDSNTNDLISYEIETLDSISLDENNNLIKGNILDISRSNDFNIKDLTKQTIVSVGSAVVGAGIGKITNNIINPYVTTFTNSTVLGNITEMASDATLSLGADYLIASAQAGEFVDKKEFFSWDRILGEGRNQIRGLLIGLANSKLNSYNSSSINAARSGLTNKTNIDMKDIPKTQQEVLETAGKLILEENNKTKAKELLSVYGMDDTQISKFIDEANNVKTKMNISNDSAKGLNNKEKSKTTEEGINPDGIYKLEPAENMGMSSKNITSIKNSNGSISLNKIVHTGKDSSGQKIEYIQEVKHNYDKQGKKIGAEVALYSNGKLIEKYNVMGNKEVNELKPTQIHQIQRVREEYAKEVRVELENEFPEAYKQFLGLFSGIAVDVNPLMKDGDIYDNDNNIMYGRAKSEDSLADKIVNKIIKGKNVQNCKDAKKIVEDGIGTRLILDKVDKKNIQKVTDRLCSEIIAGNIIVTEINNYRAENGTPYFNKKQIEQIKQASRTRYRDPMVINGVRKDYALTDDKIITGNHEKAVKKSGYTAMQMNVIYKNGALGEVQIRGKEIDQVAEVEHIPYDTKQGKKLKAKYDNAVKLIRELSDEDYSKYQKYWKDMYEYAVKKERKISCRKPKLPDKIPVELSFENLRKI